MLEGLKVVYGLKFFNVPEDEEVSYANGKYVIFCWNENSDVNNDHCDSCFGKYGHNGNEEWIQCLDLCRQWFSKQCFYN